MDAPGVNPVSEPSLPPARGAVSTVPPLWKFAVFVIACSASYLGARLVIPPVFGAVEGAFDVRFPTFVTTLSVAMLLGHWWTFRQVEPDGWRLINFDRGALRWRAILEGGALGAAAVGVPSLLLLGIGWLRFEPSDVGNVWRAAAVSLAILIPAALWEELVARGYLLALLRERFGVRPAIVVTSAGFGLMHLENAGATLQSITLVMVAGIFLGTILVALRSLYAAWAAHVAWNFVMAGVLHTSVSGIGMGAPKYRMVDAGPDWATGGVWGPEAGLFAGGGMVLATYILLRRASRPRS